MVMVSMTSWGRSFQSLMVLGRNEFCWYWVLQCSCENCWLCLCHGRRVWWLELVLKSTSGNDVVVYSVHHCQPNCLSSFTGYSHCSTCSKILVRPTFHVSAWQGHMFQENSQVSRKCGRIINILIVATIRKKKTYSRTFSFRRRPE